MATHINTRPYAALPLPFATGFSANTIGDIPSFAAPSGLSFKNCFEFSRP